MKQISSFLSLAGLVGCLFIGTDSNAQDAYRATGNRCAGLSTAYNAGRIENTSTTANAFAYCSLDSDLFPCIGYDIDVSVDVYDGSNAANEVVQCELRQGNGSSSTILDTGTSTGAVGGVGPSTINLNWSVIGGCQSSPYYVWCKLPKTTGATTSAVYDYNVIFTP